jgi:hypothetical protein
MASSWLRGCFPENHENAVFKFAIWSLGRLDAKRKE